MTRARTASRRRNPTSGDHPVAVGMPGHTHFYGKRGLDAFEQQGGVVGRPAARVLFHAREVGARIGAAIRATRTGWTAVLQVAWPVRREPPPAMLEMELARAGFRLGVAENYERQLWFVWTLAALFDPPKMDAVAARRNPRGLRA